MDFHSRKLFADRPNANALHDDLSETGPWTIEIIERRKA
jgi:hypothetical protein